MLLGLCSCRCRILGLTTKNLLQGCEWMTAWPRSHFKSRERWDYTYKKRKQKKWHHSVERSFLNAVFHCCLVAKKKWESCKGGDGNTFGCKEWRRRRRKYTRKASSGRLECDGGSEDERKKWVRARRVGEWYTARKKMQRKSEQDTSSSANWMKEQRHQGEQTGEKSTSKDED